MTEGVAQDMIVAFVQQILRMKEEAKAINDDIREIYAEAKGNGLDKTVLGKLVNYVEKRRTKAAELAEGEALFDLYLAAYDGKTGTPVATHTHEASCSDPDTGEIFEESTHPAMDETHGESAGEQRPDSSQAEAPASAPIRPEMANEAGGDLVPPAWTAADHGKGEAEPPAAVPGALATAPNAGGENVADGEARLSLEINNLVNDGEPAPMVSGSDVEPVALVLPATATSSLAFF